MLNKHSRKNNASNIHSGLGFCSLVLFHWGVGTSSGCVKAKVSPQHSHNSLSQLCWLGRYPSSWLFTGSVPALFPRHLGNHQPTNKSVKNQSSKNLVQLVRGNSLKAWLREAASGGSRMEKEAAGNDWSSFSVFPFPSPLFPQTMHLSDPQIGSRIKESLPSDPCCSAQHSSALLWVCCRQVKYIVILKEFLIKILSPFWMEVIL